MALADRSGISLNLNEGDGTFAAHRTIDSASNTGSIIVADLNGDGDAVDEVLHVFDARTGQTTNVGLASNSQRYRLDGNIVVEDHKPLFVDEWELIQKTQELGEGLLERTGVSFPSKWPIV